MKTLAIIAEFNPFHNGHRYLIQQAKNITGADNVIVIMSGNYVQRGGPAFLDKFTRTKIALMNGADLVIELPFCYSMAKASCFAHGAISILNSLNCVDYLCFGCENDKLPLLEILSDISVKEPQIYKENLKTYLQSGLAFSRAKEMAFINTIHSDNNLNNKFQMTDQMLSTFLRSPNNILAIEYLCALKILKSTIRPVSVKRSDKGYHSLNTLECENESLASATAIRNMILNKNENYLKYIPENSHLLLSKGLFKNYPIVENDFSKIIGFRLNEIIFSGNDYQNIFFDVSETTMNRILKNYDSFIDITSYIHLLNSKSITSAYIRRVLFQFILQFEKSDAKELESNQNFPYVRILGFNQNGAKIFKKIKKSKIPIVTKLSCDIKKLNTLGANILNLNMQADSIYRMVTMEKFKNHLPNEHQTGLVILK